MKQLIGANHRGRQPALVAAEGVHDHRLYYGPMLKPEIGRLKPPRPVLRANAPVLRLGNGIGRENLAQARTREHEGKFFAQDAHLVNR